MENDAVPREKLSGPVARSAESEARLLSDERKAKEVYDRLVVPILGREDDGKYVAIDFENNDYEIDPDDFKATDRLLARRPGARLWLMRAGWQAASRIRNVTRGDS